MRRLLLVLLVSLVGIALAQATPTPRDNRLVWDPSPSTDVAGNYLYWARASEPDPRMYDDSRRVDLKAVPVNAGGQKEVVLVDVQPDAEGSLYFKVTAYDAAGNESDFSNEACGFFGLPAGSNLVTSP